MRSVLTIVVVALIFLDVALVHPFRIRPAPDLKCTCLQMSECWCRHLLDDVTASDIQNDALVSADHLTELMRSFDDYDTAKMENWNDSEPVISAETTSRDSPPGNDQLPLADDREELAERLTYLRLLLKERVAYDYKNAAENADDTRLLNVDKRRRRRGRRPRKGRKWRVAKPRTMSIFRWGKRR